jgi:hypothetical protein
MIILEIWRNQRSDAVKALQQLSSPLVVPIDDSTGHVSAISESHPAIPQLAGGRLIVPIENAGLGPAINITAKLTTNSGDRPSVDYAAMCVLAPGRRAALIFGPHESLADFELQLSYEDPRARPRRLTASWRLEHRSYIEGETPRTNQSCSWAGPSLARLIEGQFGPAPGVLSQRSSAAPRE